MADFKNLPFQNPELKIFKVFNILGYFKMLNCERFEPRSHFKSRLSLIVGVNVFLNRTVVVHSD